MSAQPLAGLRVLAAEQMMALPSATQLLALLGAEVVKVEPLSGESGRHGRPLVAESDGAQTGSTFVRMNLAKSSVAIDLKQPRGRELFLSLAEHADVVAENMRPGTAEKLGIDYAAVRGRRPDVVYLSISGFGNRQDPPSPYRERAAYAPVVEAMAGLYEYARDADGPPRLASAGALGDVGPGLYGVIGVLAALHERARTGAGAYVDVAMYDAMIALADVVHLASVGVDPATATRGIGILDAFRARDGWFTVEVVREPHFPVFARAVGHPEWTTNPRLATRAGWAEHLESVIRPGVERWAADLDKAEACARLAAAGVAAGPVNQAKDILADPHVRARELVHRYAAPGEGERAGGTREIDVVGSPLHFVTGEDATSAAPPRPHPPGPEPPRRWPSLGEQTRSVLQDWLGLDDAALAALREEGVVG